MWIRINLRKYLFIQPITNRYITKWTVLIGFPFAKAIIFNFLCVHLLSPLPVFIKSIILTFFLDISYPSNTTTSISPIRVLHNLQNIRRSETHRAGIGPPEILCGYNPFDIVLPDPFPSSLPCCGFLFPANPARYFFPHLVSFANCRAPFPVPHTHEAFPAALSNSLYFPPETWWNPADCK